MNTVITLQEHTSIFRDVDNKTGSNGKFVSPWKEGQLGAVEV